MDAKINLEDITNQTLVVYVNRIVNIHAEESTIIGIYKVINKNKDIQEKIGYLVLSSEIISATGVVDILVKMYDGLLLTNKDNKSYSVYIDKHQDYLAYWLQSLQLMQALLKRGNSNGIK